MPPPLGGLGEEELVGTRSSLAWGLRRQAIGCRPLSGAWGRKKFCGTRSSMTWGLPRQAIGCRAYRQKPVPKRGPRNKDDVSGT
jgi:hypothetical protein